MWSDEPSPNSSYFLLLVLKRVWDELLSAVVHTQPSPYSSFFLSRVEIKLIKQKATSMHHHTSCWWEFLMCRHVVSCGKIFRYVMTIYWGGGWFKLCFFQWLQWDLDQMPDSFTPKGFCWTQKISPFNTHKTHKQQCLHVWKRYYMLTSRINLTQNEIMNLWVNFLNIVR